MTTTLATLANLGAAAQTADPLREATVPGPLSALESRVLEQTIPTDPAYAEWRAAGAAEEVLEQVNRQERILELTTKGIAGWSNPGLEGVTKGFAEAATGGGRPSRRGR